MRTIADGSLMASDMAEQAGVLRTLLSERRGIHDAIRRIAPHPLRGIALVGRGSSGNAALYGRIPLTLATGRPVLLLPPSMARLYGTCGRLRGYLVVGLSQSGYTAEIGETLKRCAEDDAVTLALTADPRGSITAYPDLVLDLMTGPERSIPATKTFTAEVAMLAMIAEAFDAIPTDADDWARMIAGVEDVLDDAAAADHPAALLGPVSHLSVIASGALVGVAAEVSLKLLESAGVAASHWSAEEFRHGPMSIAGVTHPIVAIAPEGRSGDDVRRTAESVRDAPSIVVGVGPDADLTLPSGLPETLAAIPAVIRGQQLALATALRRGVDPDRPHRLTKVVTL